MCVGNFRKFFHHLDVIEEKVRIRQIEYHLLHPKPHLSQKICILTVLGGVLSSQQGVKHNYGFIEVPDEYTFGAGFRRIRGTDTVSASALSSSAPAWLRRCHCKSGQIQIFFSQSISSLLCICSLFEIFFQKLHMYYLRQYIM